MPPSFLTDSTVPPLASIEGQEVPEETDHPQAAEPQSKPQRVVRLGPIGSTDYEKNLRTLVARRIGLGKEVALGAVTVDPRAPRASVVVSLNPTQTDIDTVRQLLMRAAYRTAITALFLDERLNAITVNVRLRMGADKFLAVFAGDMQREGAEELPPNPSFDQALSGFSSAWFAPPYVPPGFLNPAAPAPQTPSSQTGQ